MKKRFLTGCILGVALIIAIQTSGSALLDTQEAKAKSLASYAIGVIYDLYGLTDSAIEAFKKASEYQDNYAIRLRLGADYARLGKLTEAINDLLKALEYDPENVQARYLLALIYSTQKKYDEAAKEYENILTSFAKAEPENMEIYGYLAQLYYSQKEYDKAIQQFHAVLELEPTNKEVLFLLGALYLEKGDEDKAIEFFKRTLQLDPQHDSCLNSLGYIYANRNENLDEAKDLIARALEIDSDNGAYLDSMGWVYFKQGDYNKALEFLLNAATNLKDPVILDHLGDVYYKLNDLVNAKKFWEAALELKPEQESEIAGKIQSLEPKTDKSSF
ncbi:MAG: tetratricopeptide repeat protein [Candidatus Omnitrophota bacterium]